MLKAILACDDNWGIGKDGGLPWPHNSADLRWFKRLTERQMIIMGRNTWESLPVRPLDNRMNVVITSKEISGEQPDRVFTLDEFKAALPDLKPYKDRYIIGGAQLVNSCIDVIDEFLISRISGVYDCDTHLSADIFGTVYKLSDSYADNGVNVERWIKQ